MPTIAEGAREEDVGAAIRGHHIYLVVCCVATMEFAWQGCRCGGRPWSWHGGRHGVELANILPLPMGYRTCSSPTQQRLLSCKEASDRHPEGAGGTSTFDGDSLATGSCSVWAWNSVGTVLIVCA